MITCPFGVRGCLFVLIFQRPYSPWHAGRLRRRHSLYRCNCDFGIMLSFFLLVPRTAVLGTSALFYSETFGATSCPHHPCGFIGLWSSHLFFNSVRLSVRLNLEVTSGATMGHMELEYNFLLLLDPFLLGLYLFSFICTTVHHSTPRSTLITHPLLKGAAMPTTRGKGIPRSFTAHVFFSTSYFSTIPN